ncbi:zinc ABC transporter substrate-binding protein ZnuA [Ursidibacter arcticus]
MFKRTALSVALLSVTAAANADVLTTIKPLGFIVSAITDGVTETKVLLPTSASPHDYSLKPSDVEKLKSANLVVWVGEEMEAFLEKSVDNLSKEKVLTLGDVEDIKHIVEHAKEEKEDHHDHDHKHEHKHDHKHEHNHSHGHDHHHDHDEDWHIWLSPVASEKIAEQIAMRLSQHMPEQKAKIEENLASFKVALNAKSTEIAKQFTNVKEKGYYTFHDAYGYFEKAYGLNSLGSFTINPTIAPGAKTLNTIKKSIAKNKAICLFAEPQFTPKVIESLSKGTSAKVGQLDPLGAKVELGKDAYPQFLQSLADQFSECLGK